jgi:glyoxylase-like metal-dependent hydrolase (beta-lactamase superfamily II)
MVSDRDDKRRLYGEDSMTHLSVGPRPLSGSLPVAGEWLEVAAGVFWTRIALPFRLDHVNVYLIDDGGSWNIVDTGIANKASQETWDRLLGGRMAGRPVAKIIITHHHPDHVGLSSWLADRVEAEVLMSGTEYLLGLTYWLDSDAMKANHYREFYRARGLEAVIAESILDRAARYKSLTSALPFSFRRVMDGERLKLGSRPFEVITGGGHAPEQVMLYCADECILFAADQIMLGISPNVSVSPRNPNGDVLGLFLASLQRLASKINENAVILPGHNLPFAGLTTRVDEISRHHEARLRQIVDFCSQAPRSTADLLQILFRQPIDSAVVEFAFGEACAHVNRLLEDGRIIARVEEDGVERYIAQSVTDGHRP